jgi:hypothetical protein
MLRLRHLKRNLFYCNRTQQVPSLLASRRHLGAFDKLPSNVGLYESKNEKDSCGVGLVANLHKKASRNIVLDANQMLVRMSHRGGCGCEPNTGDGAGM